MQEGVIFDIQRMSVNNGPGIRTAAFLKGCPLRCVWCHNPESFTAEPQLKYMKNLCHFCGNCVRICKYHALEIADGELTYHESACRHCGKCSDACPYGAMKFRGETITSGRLVEIFLRDKAYYDRSGGGITLSGGEPTAQFAFMREVLEMSRQAGLSTTVDTNGFCSAQVFNTVLADADWILFDIKHMDTQQHRICTGVGNELILKNLETLAKSGKNFRIRFPMIPGYNDDTENIVALSKKLLSLGINDIDISVFHDYYIGKYDQMFHHDEIPHIRLFESSEIENRIRLFAKQGITVQRI